MGKTEEAALDQLLLPSGLIQNFLVYPCCHYSVHEPCLGAESIQIYQG